MAESFIDNSTEAQRNRLRDALCCAPITTIEARRNLDIMMPAARIFELREAGYEIHTNLIWQNTESGKPHRVAKYVLIKGSAHE